MYVTFAQRSVGARVIVGTEKRERRRSVSADGWTESPEEMPVGAIGRYTLRIRK